MEPARRQLRALAGRVLEDEHHLEERRPGGIARGVELFHQALHK